uniref:Uncharacterized protein n=1 Tax=Arundo donax TaxID=35708 RepID=A0A0A8Z157_ARUDO
MLKKVTNFFPT